MRLACLQSVSGCAVPMLIRRLANQINKASWPDLKQHKTRGGAWPFFYASQFSYSIRWSLDSNGTNENRIITNWFNK